MRKYFVGGVVAKFDLKLRRWLKSVILRVFPVSLINCILLHKKNTRSVHYECMKNEGFIIWSRRKITENKAEKR
jgi:hypothetical protein